MIEHGLHFSWLHNRSVRAAFTRFGKCVPNKQTVIFSKMTLLATTSSSTEEEISKQGFRMDKFRMPVDAVIFSLGMWWSSTPQISCSQQFQKKISQSASNRVAKRSFLYSYEWANSKKHPNFSLSIALKLTRVSVIKGLLQLSEWFRSVSCHLFCLSHHNTWDKKKKSEPIPNRD